MEQFLFQDKSGGDNFVRFTNNTTQHSGSDGFRVGNIGNGIAEIRQVEAADLRVYTNDQQRMVVRGQAGANQGYVGVNTNNPQNQVEINSQLAGATSPNPANPGGTGESGLRFTDLTSASTPQTINPGTGVLSVDAEGDVILVSQTVSYEMYAALEKRLSQLETMLFANQKF